MKSEWIEAILAVEQTRSFSRSAEMLYCSQSAVTRMVQSAEEELGMQIFSRQSKKARVELTADGNRIMPFIRAAEQANSSLADAARFMNSKTVTLCWSPHMFNSYSKVTLLERFYDENPNKVLRIKYLPTDECFRDLRSGASDVMISSAVYLEKDGPPELDFGDDVSVRILCTRSVKLAISEYHRPKGRDSFTVSDLRTMTFITHKDTMDISKTGEDKRSLYFYDACKANGFTPSLLLVGNPEDIKDIIALQGRGVYLSTAPETLRHTPGMCYVPITDIPFRVIYYMLSMKDNANKAVKNLENAVVPLFADE